MSSQQAADADARADEGTQRRGRGYTLAGFLLIFALVAVVAVGMAGIAGPGILSEGEAFFVLSGAVAVLGVAVVGLLFSMRDTLNLVREQQATIDDLQDERHEASEGERQRTDRDLAAEVAHLRALIVDDAAPDEASAGPPETTPFGDIHAVIDVEGIGETFSAKLESLNIIDTEQLWQADATEIAEALDIPTRTVRNWQIMAELMALKDVGPQYAELLQRSGISSIDELAAMEPEEVARAVQEAESEVEVRIQGNPISSKHTRKWIQAAQEHDPKTMRVQR